jgi:hypothetical protein
MPAQSKAQQRFMGMVHAVQKGDMEAPSKEIEKAADSMTNKDAKDYASTSHKGLPNKKENMKITKERLKELVKDVMTEESEYQAFFQKALDKAGKGINDMNDDEKKTFFNKIDAAWNGKGEKNENVNEYDEWGNTRIQAKNIFRMLKQKYNNNISKMKDGLELILKQNKTKNDQAEVMRDEFNKFFKIKEAELTGNQHKLDVDKDGDIEGDDLADLRAGKKVDEAAELPAATIPASIKSKLVMAIDKIKDSKLNYNQKIQVIGQVMDSLGIDKGEFNKMSSKLKGTMESSIKEESPCWKGYQQIGMKDKGGKQVPNCVPEGKVNEAASPKDMDKIKAAVEAASSFMGVGSELKKLGMKYTFATEPLAIYIVQPTPNNKVAIVNKRYASKPDFVVGDIAVGIMEGIKYAKK